MSALRAPARRVVIGANAHAALQASLHALRGDLEIRGSPYTAVTDADFAWGDTYVGFKRPPLASMGSIRWVHCTGAGVDAWLYPTELPRDILLTRTSEPFGPMIAEWALARALAFTQQLLPLAACQRRHEWASHDVTMLRGTTAVIVGTGEVGGKIARLFDALGCTVHGVSRSGSGSDPAFATMSRATELSRVVQGADWLIVTVPETLETRGMIDRTLLESCHGAVLINAGRGAVVEESAIPDLLAKGCLRGAALDVFETEPLPAASPLWDDPRVMISPHLSGPSTVYGTVAGFVECLGELERGQIPTRVVDRDRQY